MGERRPDLLPELRRLERLSTDTPIRWHEAPYTLAEEKDAVAVALRIAGFRPDEVQAWTPSDQIAPYLTGLAQARLREDPIIAHDAQVFGDWTLLERFAVGAAIFARRDQRLTVLNANRSPIEGSVGVDLIYYHHRYASYVLVQYKRMTEEQDGMGRRWVYRPEATWEAERQRIKSFEQKFRSTARADSSGAYRLSPGGFFLKLAEATTFEPLSTDMIAGMYFPFDYWELVVSSPQVRGPRGGVNLTYDNTDRHLNNSDFIRLVQGGWIGTRAVQTSALTEIIRVGLAEGRSIMLAAQMSDGTEHIG